MSNLREVKEDILKEWINFREEDLLRYVTEEDKKYNIYFDEISENILKLYNKRLTISTIYQSYSFINYMEYQNILY